MIALPQWGQMIFALSEGRNNSATSTPSASAIFSSDAVSVHDNICPVGNGLDIRHMLCELF
jgi:hypothetical protein